MAGYTTVYTFGQAGGFRGCDGVNEIEFMLLEGTAGRMWFCAKHFTNKYSPMGKVEVFIPQDPYDVFVLLDACLLFAPQLFQACPTLEIAKKQMSTKKRVDFDAEPELVTPEWRMLRSEASDIYKKLPLWRADLQQLKL